MTSLHELLLRAVALAPAWPALGALLLGVLSVRGRAIQEHTAIQIAQSALWLSFLSVLCGVVAHIQAGGAPIDINFGSFYRVGDYGFELRFLLDKLSASTAVLASLLLLATSRFSAHYLHRENGFLRFFTLMLVFSAGMELLILSGSYDLLFAGWEMVGLTSVLLVGFFQDRAGPVQASLRVLITYRICDIGLLLTPVSLHVLVHSSAFVDVQRALGQHASGLAMTPVALLIFFAAMGKSAQFPVGGWLPRAMEGPTASSAIFYGGLSVHAGIYLLLRSAPILTAAPLSSAILCVIGAATAIMAALSAQVSADAKSGLVYATISQVGLMVVECGLGLYTLATIHMLAHILLRYYQFLRTPSALQDALSRRAAIGRTLTATGTAPRTPGVSRFLYRLAIERFEVEATLDRWLARPVLGAARALGRAEDRIVDWIAGSPTDEGPRTGPAPAPPTSTGPAAQPGASDGRGVA